MAGRRVYWVRYLGEMNDDDRVMLDRPGFRLAEGPGFTLHENGDGVTAAFRGDEMPEPTTFQIVRVTAGNPEDARRKVIEALGREPSDLRAWPA
jgi:hypothetical protein